MNIVQQRVQEALDQNPRHMELGGEVFNVDPQPDEYRIGKSTRAILEEMRVAAQEELLIKKPSDRD